MSWDWYIKEAACEACGAGSTYATRNVTYNLSRMFEMALGCSIRDLDGKPMAEVSAIAQAGLDAMRALPGPFREHEPANRWGTYESAMRDLEWLVDHETPPADEKWRPLVLRVS